MRQMAGMREMEKVEFLLDWARRTVQHADQGLKVSKDELKRARAIVEAWRRG